MPAPTPPTSRPHPAQALRSQIEMYKVQHGGPLPDLLTSWNPLINATVYNGKTVALHPAPQKRLNNLATSSRDAPTLSASATGFVYRLRRAPAPGN